MFEEVQRCIEESENIFVFTGAGVSVASGLATYRGEDGVHESSFKGYKASEISHIKTLKGNPAVFWEFKRQTLMRGLYAKPNAAHQALVLLEKYCKRKGKGFTIVTQNVDRLHQRAGSRNVVEVHGHVSELHCTNVLSCRHIVNARDHLDAHPEPMAPLCPRCNSVLRPPVVLFGEKYPSNMIDLLKMKIKNYADLFISAGTSYQIFSPITSFPRIFKAYREQGVLLDFNVNKTHVSRQFANLFVEGPCDETLWRSVEFLREEFGVAEYIHELRAVYSDSRTDESWHALVLKLKWIKENTPWTMDGLIDLMRSAFLLEEDNELLIEGCWETLEVEGRGDSGFFAELRRLTDEKYAAWLLLL